MASFDYSGFLNSICRKQWQRFGLQRRAGVCAPLFSLYSSKSIGIGELPDLKLLADWCVQTRMSIIQLLPMNDTGFNFTPYDAQSTFALDPMYLSLENLAVAPGDFKGIIEPLRRQFPAGRERVDYGVKKAKLDALWKIFQALNLTKKPAAFDQFLQKNHYWLEDYVLFKIIKEGYQETGWEAWPEPFRNRDGQALQHLKENHRHRILFHQWLQWQLFEQFRAVKNYANEKKVYLLGDLPFLVSRDSADVWAHQDYFKLDLSSGAPPDLFFARGQRWGMPPYQWPAVEAHGFDYLIEKVRYSENFYDMFRIDHVVGTFRLWTIPLSEPAENGGMNGTFDPANEGEWNEHGRKLLSIMIQNASMLPCAEDLGVVPECSYSTLRDFALPGMDVQRWTKNWDGDCGFKDSSHYRYNSIAVLSNHDMTSFHGWWTFEAGTIDEELFKRKCREKGLDFEQKKSALFDASRSHHGRLRWKDEIRDAGRLAEILERPYDQVADIAELYRGSFDEKHKFWNYLGLPGNFEEAPSVPLVQKAFEKASVSSSIFSIQMLQDLLDLGPVFPHDAWQFRINFPGTTGPHNWSLVIPVALEKLKDLEINNRIKKINELGDRV